MTSTSRCLTCGDLTQFNVEGKWQDLQTTAKAGCEACAMLTRGVQSFNINADDVTNFLIQIDVTLYLRLTSEDNRSESLDVTLEFYTEEEKMSRWRKVGPGRHVARNLRDDQSIALMKRWLSECLHTHSACRRDTSSQLPTRLIAVGASNNELHLHVPNPEERSEYVALSHHWGRHRPLVTTKASLETHQEHFKLDESSRLFAEAIELTRMLGFSYIWIDSLCIIQDSDEDWSREAANMTTVFNNATLTLFAHASQDSSCSLYPDTSLRNQSIALPIMDQMKDEQKTDTHSETVYVREIHRYPHRLASSYHSARAPKPSFLAPRGWVLQEELLSPRSLHFHTEEMSWTCSSYSRCECRIRPNIPLPSLYRDPPTKFEREASDPDNSQAESTNQDRVVPSDIQQQFALSNPTEREGEVTADLLADWPSVVMEYSHRSLTKPSDKLPALTGLAGYIQKVSPNEKFAGGLWLSDLSFQLLWSRDNMFESQRTSEMTDEAKADRQRAEMEMYASRHLYSATWSWVSLPTHAAVHYPTRHMTRSPMKRSHDYAQRSEKSLDHFSHFVKPLFGDSDFVNILDLHAWVPKVDIHSWGPGLLTLACRCIYISVFKSTISSDDSDKTESQDSTKETQGRKALTANLSFTTVDQFGRRGGSWPSDVDLASFKFDWDFPILQQETPSWMIDTRLTAGHIAMINKWRDYRHEYSEPGHPKNPVRDAASASNESATRRDKEENVRVTSSNLMSEGSSAQEMPTPESPPMEGNTNPTFALVLAGIMTWVYNFTPKRVEGVCLLLEQVDGANGVYRRVGHVTGVGSAEAWVKDVPKRVIHIV